MIANIMDFRYLWVVFNFSFYFFVTSCNEANQHSINTSEFILQPGFQIDLVAAEPLIDSPVAMQFDQQGRIWVVELPGYMRDIDGSDEDFPDGKIVILSDEDHDGVMDKRTIFMDHLTAPRTLLFAYHGLLYSDGTALLWTAIDQDQPSNRTIVDSSYVIGGNIEHQSNGLLYHLDNWIYSAISNVRYRMKNGEWVKEPTSLRGQWGLASDEAGRLFYNDNSNPLMGDYAMPNVLTSNPYQLVEYGQHQLIATDRRVFPYQATAVNRGYEDGVLDESGKLLHFTSACSPVIYKGDQFPAAYVGDAFVCGPEANLIKRYSIQENGINITATQPYEGQEFLVSKEESFRPVNLYSGLDGALYVVDLRKGFIQHRAFMTNYLREKILDRGLDNITGLGRIYKIHPIKKEKSATVDFSTFSLVDYVALLQHENGEVRMLAQKEIVFSNDKTLEKELEKIASNSKHPKGQIHALWTLEGLGILDETLLQNVLNVTEEQEVVAQIIRLAGMFPDFDILPAPAFDHGQADLYLCHLAGKTQQANGEKIWMDLATHYSNEPIFCEALISGISSRETYFLDKISHLGQDSLHHMMQRVVANSKNKAIKGPQLTIGALVDRRTEGFKLYNTYCVSCHGHDGKGNPSLAPPLYPSEYVSGPPERMVLIALQGLKGPLMVNGKKYDMNLVMPGIKDNPDLTDEKIADLMIFIRNAFTEGLPGMVTPAMVKDARASLKGHQEMFTAESLNRWMEEHY